MKEFHVVEGPFLNSNNSTKKIMRNLLLALVPIIIFSVYKNGYIPFKNGKVDSIGLLYPLLFILLPTIISYVTELLYAFIILHLRKRKLREHLKSSFSIFPGLFLGLILPINTPISIVILGALVATVIGKLIYGGFGNNIFNPALIGRLFVISMYAAIITANGGYLNNYEIDTISSSTPLSNASVIEGIGAYKTLVAPYGTLKDFFFGTIPGAVGETSALLCIIGFIFLTLTKTIKWKIPTTYVLTVFLMTYLIGGINSLDIWYPLFQILSGGLMFGAVFMATDPVTSPVTNVGQVLYGIFLGILTVVFRYLTPYPEGVLTSILTMNLFVVILDRIGSKARFNIKKSTVVLISSLLIMLGLGIYIGNIYASSNGINDPNFSIISKEQSGGKISYIVTEKGYSSDIKALIEFKDSKISKLEILEQNDSFYFKVDDAKYIDKLIKNQVSLSDLDTVSGATVTSTALKKLVINTITDYKNNGGSFVELDPDFTIFSRENDGNKIVYEVTQKGFKDNIKLRVIFNYDVVETITVLEQNDSYFSSILDDNYITKIIENQQILDKLDTVSGATVTSTTLKRAIKNTKEDYGRNYEK